MTAPNWSTADLPPDPWHNGDPEGPDDVFTADPIWGLPGTERVAIEERRRANERESQEGSQ